MDPEELEPRVQKPALRLLDPLSVAELETYIAELHHEIDRVKAVIAAKQAVRAGADGLFKR